ncbi:MAG: hypothetical protein HY914_14335 [Desulfomonile tiedjei]|nr:hypothetical protein [Desulfomonile tiedjei]
MVKTFVALVCAFFLFAFVAHAQDSFTAYGSTVNFTPPDPAKWKLTRNGMDEKSKKYVVMFEHTPIRDAAGNAISPVIAIVGESVPDEVDVIQYSTRLRGHAPFKVNKTIGHQDGSLAHKNSVGYEGEYNSGAIHKVLVGHLRHGAVGVQVICDSTDGVYDKVEADMRAFLRSVTFGEQPATPGAGQEQPKDR